MIIKIGCMDQLVDLVFKGIIVGFVPVAKSKNRDSGAKIQILFPVSVGQADAFPFFEHDRKTVICMKNHLFRAVHDIL